MLLASRRRAARALIFATIVDGEEYFRDQEKDRNVPILVSWKQRGENSSKPRILHGEFTAGELRSVDRLPENADDSSIFDGLKPTLRALLRKVRAEMVGFTQPYRSSGGAEPRPPAGYFPQIFRYASLYPFCGS